MKDILITQAQMEALGEMGLYHVVSDSEGVVYSAYASEQSAKAYAAYVGDVNGRPVSAHWIKTCVPVAVAA